MYFPDEMKPTMNLKWITEYTYDGEVEEKQLVLQQQWISNDGKTIEWRDIEIDDGI